METVQMSNGNFKPELWCSGVIQFPFTDVEKSESRVGSLKTVKFWTISYRCYCVQRKIILVTQNRQIILRVQHNLPIKQVKVVRLHSLQYSLQGVCYKKILKQDSATDTKIYKQITKMFSKNFNQILCGLFLFLFFRSSNLTLYGMFIQDKQKNILDAQSSKISGRRQVTIL